MSDDVPTNTTLEGNELDEHFGEDIDAGQRQRDRQQRGERRNLDDVFQSLADHGWADNEPPELKALVEHDNGPWLPREKVGTLIAPGATGKTQMLLQLAMVIASPNRDRQWLDTFDVPERGPVVVALGEEGERDLHRRIADVLDVWQLADGERAGIADRLHPVPMAGKRTALMGARVWPWQLEGTVETETIRRLVERTGTRYEVARSLVEAANDGDPIHDDDRFGDKLCDAYSNIDRDRIAERLMDGRTDMVDAWHNKLRNPPESGWKAIILDPASQFIGPEVEKDNASATQFVQLLQEWANRRWGDQTHGPTVLCAHHASQGAANSDADDFLNNAHASRGATGLTAGVRWQCNATVLEDAQVDGREPTGDVIGLKVNKFNDAATIGTSCVQRGRKGVIEATDGRITPNGSDKSDEGGKNTGMRGT